MKVHIELELADRADVALAEATMHTLVVASQHLTSAYTAKTYDIIKQKGGIASEVDLAAHGLKGHAWTLVSFGLLKKNAAGFSQPRDLKLPSEPAAPEVPEAPEKADNAA